MPPNAARRHGQGQPPFAHEAGEIVDMAVGMVADQPLAEPQQAVDAERLVQSHLDIRARQRRVAVDVEQAFLGRDAKSGAVDVDPAAFEHPILLIDGQAAFGRQRRADFLIARHHEFLAPPVETKVARAPFQARSHNDRSRVAQPDVAERLHQNAHRGIDESRSNLRLPLVIDHQPHLLAAPAVVDNVGKSSDIGPRRIDLSRPLVIEVRKADPHCGVRRPFGGHGERHGRRLAYLPSRDLSRAARNSSPSFQLGQLSVDASIRPAA